MPKFIIEREIPGAGQLSGVQLKAIAKKSTDILCKMGTGIQWIHSYVAGDKIYCIYLADNEEKIIEHAKLGGFPANCITKISTIFEPLTAE